MFSNHSECELFSTASDPHWRIRLLQWLRITVGPQHLVVLAVIRGLGIGPHGLDNFYSLTQHPNAV